jgi:hypothetical protein
VVKVKGLKNPVSFWKLKSLIYKDSKYGSYEERWYRQINHGLIEISKGNRNTRITDTKRDLIFDSCGKFIDTRPYVLKNGIIIYEKPFILYYLPVPDPNKK